MKTIFISVILNLFQDLTHEEARCRNKFGMTKKITRGFTLIELLIAISIIGILSSFLLANFVGARQRARDGVRKSDLRQIQAALELYRSDKAEYPAKPLPTCGLSLEADSIIYMKKIPCDPSTKAIYLYNVDGGKTTYSIIACLENGSDSQKDAVNVDSCKNAGSFSYTLENP